MTTLSDMTFAEMWMSMVNVSKNFEKKNNNNNNNNHLLSSVSVNTKPPRGLSL
jgi:hypothetical protein